MEEDAAVRLAEPGGGVAREHADDAGRAPRGVETDADEASVGLGAAHDGDVDHAGQRQIVHVAAPPGEQARIAPLDAGSDVGHRVSRGAGLVGLVTSDRR